MAHFYLHLWNGPDFVGDEEGMDFPDLVAAHEGAIKGLRGISAGDLLMGRINTSAYIEIEDERHALVDTVYFVDAVKITTIDPAPRSARSCM